MISLLRSLLHPLGSESCCEETVSPNDCLSDEELTAALASIKSGKCLGADKIPIEAYQQSPAACKKLFRINRLIWDLEVVPEDSFLGIFFMLYKKNDHNDFGNYRAICLPAHAYKLLSAIITPRFHLILADIHPDSQAGFRPARGTRDNI